MQERTACLKTRAGAALLGMRGVVNGGRKSSHDEEASSVISKRAVRFFKFRVIAAALIFASAAAPAVAVNPGEQLSDPKLEARARTLGYELRCMVCQNQSIDDSDAPLAKDLRLLVRERLAAGDADNQVLDFLVARYGEFVLLRPRVRGETLLLWGVAPAVLGLGLAGYLVWAFRSRGRATKLEALSEEERSRLDALVADGEAPKKPAAEAPGPRLT